MRLAMVVAAMLCLAGCSKDDSKRSAASASKSALGQMNRDFAAALNAKDAAKAASY